MMLQAKVTQTLLHAVCHHRPCILQLDLALSPSVFFHFTKFNRWKAKKQAGTRLNQTLNMHMYKYIHKTDTQTHKPIRFGY